MNHAKPTSSGMRRATVWHAGGMVFVMATVFAMLPIRAHSFKLPIFVSHFRLSMFPS
jgi:hypothetical protein